MATQNSSTRAIKPMRWTAEEWDYLAGVAKAIGMTRSAFVRTAALNAARATQSLSASYSVDGATATPQNTAANQLAPSTAKQGRGEGGGRRSRTRLAPEAINGPIPEELGRGGPTNEAGPEAEGPTGPRS